jgi:hypothetical protein
VQLELGFLALRCNVTASVLLQGGDFPTARAALTEAVAGARRTNLMVSAFLAAAPGAAGVTAGVMKRKAAVLDSTGATGGGSGGGSAGGGSGSSNFAVGGAGPGAAARNQQRQACLEVGCCWFQQQGKPCRDGSACRYDHVAAGEALPTVRKAVPRKRA